MILVILVAEEKKRAVSSVVDSGQPHRRPGNAPERMSLEWTHGGVERISRVECVVLYHLPDLPMQFIGAGFGGRVDRSTHHATELGRVVVRLHLELLDGLHDG